MSRTGLYTPQQTLLHASVRIYEILRFNREITQITLQDIQDEIFLFFGAMPLYKSQVSSSSLA